jgi:peptidoglycan/xylan/chitin deacetylase (PgdA/CDA1 family)
MDGGLLQMIPVRSAILTYHSLDESGSVISTSPAKFRAQMECLARSVAKVVPLSEVFQQRDAVAITFDDGFVNFAEHAVPVLERLSMPATVFVVSGYCGRRNRWQQPPGIPDLPLMNWSMLRDLPACISLGAHSITHPDMRTLKDEEVTNEVRNSRTDIEQKTGRAVTAFAYPYGAVDRRAAAAVLRESMIGCGTRMGFLEARCDRAVLPRLDTFYLRSASWPEHLFGPSMRMYVALRRWLRQARAAYASRVADAIEDGKA